MRPTSAPVNSIGKPALRRLRNTQRLVCWAVDLACVNEARVSLNQERFFIVNIVKNSMAKSFAVVLVFSFALAAFGVSEISFAQKKVKGSAAGQVSSLLSSLPPSDALALVNVKRVLDEALPKLLAENPAKVPEINEELAKFRA